MLILLDSFLLIGLPSMIILVMVMQLFLSLLQVNGVKSFGPTIVPDDSEKEAFYIFCEPFQQGEHLVKQPSLAWSALMYNFIGIIVIFIPSAENRKKILFQRQSEFKVFRNLMFFILSFMGLASFSFHASLTPLSYYLDHSSIQPITSVLLVFAFMKFYYRRGTAFKFFMLVGIVTAILLGLDMTLLFLTNLDFGGSASSVFFLYEPVLILSPIVLEYIRQHRFRNRLKSKDGGLFKDNPNGMESQCNVSTGLAEEAGSVACTHCSTSDDIENIKWLHWMTFYMSIAFLCWLLDFVGHICMPIYGGFQFHAVWHFGTCMSVVFGYLYMVGY